MKIVVLDGYTLNPGDLSWDGLKTLGRYEIFNRTLHGEVFSRVKDADIVLTNKVIIDSGLMKKLPGLKYIGVLATGYNVVDVKTAKELGITVTNIPAYSTDSVAQLVFAHILNFARRVETHAGSVKQGAWAESIDFMYQLTPQKEITGKVLGIIGLGKIGKAVAKIGLAFGMEVIFNDRVILSNTPGNIRLASLKTLFRESDFISINCPLDNTNKGFVNKQLLNLAKPSAFVINTGRGPLVNEQDVAEALNNGKIAGYGADVLSTEPPLPGNPLLSAKNSFITPHIAWATKEARARLMNIAVDNIKMFLDGNPVNTVN